MSRRASHPHALPPAHRGRTDLFILALMAWLFHSYVHAETTPDDRGSPLRLGFSQRLFNGLNQNDAIAAVKAFGQTIAHEQRVPVRPLPSVLGSVHEAVAAIRDGTVDIVGLQTPEYAALIQIEPASLDPVLTTFNAGRDRERYILLVHDDAPFRQLADLRGQRLAVDESARMGLGLIWLEVLLAENALPDPSQLFRRREPTTKSQRAILPTFFRTSDATLTFLSAFEASAELNPQLRKRLRILAQSDELVPVVLALRASYRPAFREDLVRGLTGMHSTIAGQQALTIFRSERLQREPEAVLKPTLDLIHRHANLTTHPPPAQSGP